MNSGISGKTFTFLKNLFKDVLTKNCWYFNGKKNAIILNLLDKNQIFELARKLRILQKYFLQGFPGQKPCKDIPSIKSWPKIDLSKSFWSKTTDFYKYFWGFYDRKSWAILGIFAKIKYFMYPPVFRKLFHGSPDQGHYGKIVKIVVEYFQDLLRQETVGLLNNVFKRFLGNKKFCDKKIQKYIFDLLRTPCKNQNFHWNLSKN